MKLTTTCKNETFHREFSFKFKYVENVVIFVPQIVNCEIAFQLVLELNLIGALNVKGIVGGNFTKKELPLPIHVKYVKM